MKKGLIVVVCIAIAIGGIWLYKADQKSKKAKYEKEIAGYKVEMDSIFKADSASYAKTIETQEVIEKYGIAIPKHFLNQPNVANSLITLDSASSVYEKNKRAIKDPFWDLADKGIKRMSAFWLSLSPKQLRTLESIFAGRKVRTVHGTWVDGSNMYSHYEFLKNGESTSYNEEWKASPKLKVLVSSNDNWRVYPLGIQNLCTDLDGFSGLIDCSSLYEALDMLDGTNEETLYAKLKQIEKSFRQEVQKTYQLYGIAVEKNQKNEDAYKKVTTVFNAQIDELKQEQQNIAKTHYAELRDFRDKKIESNDMYLKNKYNQ